MTAAVYLKNRVTGGWAPADELPLHRPISEEDKTELRNRLLPILASSTPQTRAQLLPLLQKILQYDFPANWPNFVNVAQQFLVTADAPSVLAGLQCFLALSRTYRYRATDNREEYQQIVQVTFPQMLGIGPRLVGETSPEAWEMLHIILKTFKHAIYVRENALLPNEYVAESSSSSFLRVFQSRRIW